MKEELTPKTYFWPYDIFGYLLPGLAAVAALGKANAWAYANIHVRWESGRLLDLAMLLCASYVVGHVIAGLSSLILEKYIVSKALRWPTSHMFREGGESRPAAYLFPSYTRPYSPQFQQEFRRRFEKVFGLDPTDEHDRFWLAWGHITLHHAVAFRRATHFLELYGFSRNMSMSLLLIALLPFIPGWTGPINRWVWIPVLLASAFVLFVSYTKLLRRLNDEVYRGFVASTPPLDGAVRVAWKPEGVAVGASGA